MGAGDYFQSNPSSVFDVIIEIPIARSSDDASRQLDMQVGSCRLVIYILNLVLKSRLDWFPTCLQFLSPPVLEVNCRGAQTSRFIRITYKT